MTIHNLDNGVPFVQHIKPDGSTTDSYQDVSNEVKSHLMSNMLGQMIFTRMFDQKVVEMQKKQEVHFYTSSEGEEAVGIGLTNAVNLEDRLLMAYRQHPAHVMRGEGINCVDMMVRTMLFMDGDEQGNVFEAVNSQDFPICVPIGTQCVHAVGVAMAMKIRKEHSVAVTVIGDGGTSEGDFYVSLNAAGTWNLPLVFVIINNQWAISVPRKHQSGAETLAQKGFAGGIKNCVQVDGNDVVAVYSVMKEALDRARRGEGPSVIEAMTYRLGNHTTIDDARRYRKNTDVECAREKEPIVRLRKHLESVDMWNSNKEEQHIAECSDAIDTAVERYKSFKDEDPEAIIDFMHATLPDALKMQRDQIGVRAKQLEERSS